LAAPQHGRSLYARTVSAIALADEARGRSLSCRTLRLLVLGMAQIVRLTCPAKRDGFLFF
jgi:hypothetical protein